MYRNLQSVQRPGGEWLQCLQGPGDAGIFTDGQAQGTEAVGLDFNAISKGKGRLRKLLLEEEGIQSALTQSCDEVRVGR